MKLHLGCGPRIIPGWINGDIEPVVGAIHIDALHTHYENESCSRIYCEDLIEHFSQQDQLQFFREIKRLLKIGGLAHVTCPELFHSLKREENPWHWGHLCIPTFGYLEKLAEFVGLRCLTGSQRFREPTNGFPMDLRPHAPRTPEENIYLTLYK